MPVVDVTPEDVAALKTHKPHGIRLFAAVGGTGATAAQAADFTKASALLIGNEGTGLATEWMRLADERVTIPCPGPVESLNAAVAGSLLLYEASRQRSAR
jgi:TrmH family RNA methyltransferase